MAIEALAEIWDDVASSFQATSAPVAAARMFIAACFGALVGIERELSAKAAGLRTHILISLGACLFALVSFEIVEFAQQDPTAQSADPLRLISSVTSGVAFLAAGSIIVSKGRVRGLTTGAGMWMAGAIGLACGVGKIGLAAMATGFVLAVLWLLRGVKEALAPEEEPPVDSKGGG
ncbi:MgtC/SapB family protein [Neomegalonema sp.]|uniref:MgtC/SapB family protein n=1 Tax=Neomegalonema sp. TaxID=2039713 RepID=UPI0026093434|nr:MgtC/SapB family protein [Neomegalonema sp.]MDD2869139.1 MgtC/SapB family protein [Neomegalonema sp.]